MIRSAVVVLLIWASLACSLTACPVGDPPVQPAEGELSFLTYNVHGLPPQITGDDTAARMVEIGPLLRPFDVVGLQEDFDDVNHGTLAAASDHLVQRRFADLQHLGDSLTQLVAVQRAFRGKAGEAEQLAAEDDAPPDPDEPEPAPEPVPDLR